MADSLCDYQDFEIDVDTETGEIVDWHYQSPMQIAIDKAAERFPKAEKRKPTNIIEVIAGEMTKLIRNGREVGCC